MSQTLPNERIDAVAKAVSKALSDVATKDQDRRDARDVLTDASSTATTARESLLVALAEAAANDHWSKYEIDEGVEHALKDRNDKDATIKTFTAEIRRACHPEARKHVPAFAKLAADVWNQETAQSKDLPKPCRAAFARQYHLFQRLLTEAIDNSRVLENRDDVVKWAIALDPKNNPTRMFKRFKALRDELREMGDMFDVANVTDADEYLREVTADDFKPAKKAAAKAPKKPAGAPKQAPASQVPESESGDPEPATNVSDLLDDALRDLGA
jgi:hypothetical protein